MRGKAQLGDSSSIEGGVAPVGEWGPSGGPKPSGRGLKSTRGCPTRVVLPGMGPLGPMAAPPPAPRRSPPASLHPPFPFIPDPFSFGISTQPGSHPGFFHA